MQQNCISNRNKVKIPKNNRKLSMKKPSIIQLSDFSCLNFHVVFSKVINILMSNAKVMHESYRYTH